MSLTDQFPHAVEINGAVCEVNTDYRTGLKIMQAWEDRRLLNFEKQALTVGLLFKNPPDDLPEAMRMASKFLDCGRVYTSDDMDGGRVYSFTRDAEAIYSAFLQTYGVDLKDPSTSMHWWKFVAMFNDLSDDTLFERMVSMRSRYRRGKLTKEEKELWYSMADVLDLDREPEDEETAQARENFEKLLRG